MPATRDGKTWRSQFYYEDWQGVRHKKNKRGFKTKAEAEEWERNFRQQQRKDLDINFENFVEIYFADMENRFRESTIKNKRYVFDLKVTPYFKKKKMCEIIEDWKLKRVLRRHLLPEYLQVRVRGTPNGSSGQRRRKIILHLLCVDTGLIGRRKTRTICIYPYWIIRSRSERRKWLHLRRR